MFNTTVQQPNSNRRNRRSTVLEVAPKLNEDLKTIRLLLSLIKAALLLVSEGQSRVTSSEVLFRAKREYGVNAIASVAGGETDFSATRLGVALECYRRRHGRTPATLEGLVPEILDAVPRDVFDGEPLRYDAHRCAIYSVGPDLIDEGGSEGEHPTDMPDPTYVLGR